MRTNRLSIRAINDLDVMETWIYIIRVTTDEIGNCEIPVDKEVAKKEEEK